MTDVHPTDAGVVVRTEHSLGRLTLDRPAAINALDVHMIRALRAALDAWRGDADIDTVLLDGAGDRGLCAGGDVRALYASIVAGSADEVGVFFREEYALNAAIDEYPAPIVAFADGITMGGGIGLAGHAAVRIVTERSRLAMPETRIGFTPDVGGSYLLSRAPGRLGEYLALTGDTMSASDAIHAGFADHFVPSAHLDAIRDALVTRADPSGPAELVLLFDDTPEASELAAKQPWIDATFDADTVPGIIAKLHAVGEAEASALADRLTHAAPTALAVTLEAVRRARELPTLRAVLEQEYRLVLWFAHTQPDMVEGIRAQLVDKDRDPHWNPATHDGVTPDTIAAAFSYEPAVPLWS